MHVRPCSSISRLSLATSAAVDPGLNNGGLNNGWLRLGALVDVRCGLNTGVGLLRGLHSWALLYAGDGSALALLLNLPIITVGVQSRQGPTCTVGVDGVVGVPGLLLHTAANQLSLCC